MLSSSDPARPPGAWVKPPAADSKLWGAFRVPWGPVRRRGGGGLGRVWDWSGRGPAGGGGRGAAGPTAQAYCGGIMD